MSTKLDEDSRRAVIDSILKGLDTDAIPSTGRTVHPSQRKPAQKIAAPQESAAIKQQPTEEAPAVQVTSRVEKERDSLDCAGPSLGKEQIQIHMRTVTRSAQGYTLRRCGELGIPLPPTARKAA